MSNWTGFTNQRLYQAKLAIGLVNEEQVNPALFQAQLEGAAMQLMVAYRSYLNELGDKYRCSKRVYSALELKTHCAVTTAQISELVNLEQSDSWLSDLIQVSENIGWPDAPEKKAKVVDPTASTNLITSDAVSRSITKISESLLTACLSRLEALIEQQRSLSVEY